MKSVFNPYLPSYEYIPDGEPHVFDGRIYIYGSHDRFDGKKFCLNHYVCYSAPVTDLSDWKYEGTIYRNDQDIRMTKGDHELWAPDVVKGKDGRYYLYYCPDDILPEIGVAVCDSPAGKYEFLGLVSDKTGIPIGDRKGDTIQFDPGIFIRPDGSIQQAEMTSCGLNGEPLEGKGYYPAYIVCNLFGKHTPAISHPLAMRNRHPYLTQDGEDVESSPHIRSADFPVQYITNGKNGMVAAFKYFSFHNLEKIVIKVRGNAAGVFKVPTSPKGESIGEIQISPSKDWKSFENQVHMPDGKHALYFTFNGKGKVNLMGFTLI